MKCDITGLLRHAQRHLRLLDKIKDGELNPEDLEDRYEVISAEEILQELIDNIAIVRADPAQLDKFLEIYCLKEQCNSQEFIAAVGQMRSLQQQYFKSRSPEILKQAKAAEAAVDKAIQEFTSHKQTSLF